jgi:hypothetical protein
VRAIGPELELSATGATVLNRSCRTRAPGCRGGAVGRARLGAEVELSDAHHRAEVELSDARPLG